MLVEFSVRPLLQPGSGQAANNASRHSDSRAAATPISRDISSRLSPRSSRNTTDALRCDDQQPLDDPFVLLVLRKNSIVGRIMNGKEFQSTPPAEARGDGGGATVAVTV